MMDETLNSLRFCSTTLLGITDSDSAYLIYFYILSRRLDEWSFMKASKVPDFQDTLYLRLYFIIQSFIGHECIIYVIIETKIMM